MAEIELNKRQYLEFEKNSAGMARSFISKVERGDANPSVTSVKKIADTLGVMPSELWLKAEQYL